MFGIMQPEQSCGIEQKTTPAYNFHRKHYCGSCKAIGSSYGQRARLMLNFDTVFLAELLSDLLEDDTTSWGHSFQTPNRCFTMPKKQDETPISLEYAAAVNVLLGQLKIDDHLTDSGKWYWKSAKKLFSKSFRKVTTKFESWNIDVQDFWKQINEQKIREQAALADFEQLEDILKYYAQPTAEITSKLFEQAAFVINKEKLANKLHQLGFLFGQLAYAVDALEDLEQDIFKNQFNPLSLYFDCDKTLSKNQREDVQEFIINLQGQVTSVLQELPLQEEQIAVYSGRLLSNISQLIYQEQAIPQTWKERRQNRWKEATQFAHKVTCSSDSWTKKLQYYTISLAVFIRPHTTEQISPGNVGMGVSGMALIASLLTVLGVGLGVSYSRDFEKNPRKKRKKKACKGKRQKENTNGCDCFNKCNDCCDACMSFLAILGFGAVIAGGLALTLAGAIGIFVVVGMSYYWALWIVGLVVVMAAIGLFAWASNECHGKGADNMSIFLNISLFGLGIVLLISVILGIIMVASGMALFGGVFLGVSLLLLLILLLIWIIALADGLY